MVWAPMRKSALLSRPVTTVESEPRARAMRIPLINTVCLKLLKHHKVKSPKRTRCWLDRPNDAAGRRSGASLPSRKRSSRQQLKAASQSIRDLNEDDRLVGYKYNTMTVQMSNCALGLAPSSLRPATKSIQKAERGCAWPNPGLGPACPHRQSCPTSRPDKRAQTENTQQKARRLAKAWTGPACPFW